MRLVLKRVLPTFLTAPGRAPWGIPASLAVHGLFVLLLVLYGVHGLPAPPPEQGIEVEILTPAQLPAPPGRSPHSEGPAAPGQPPAMMRATRLLSEEALSDPRSARARSKLAGLGADERAVQICDVEAIEQIHAWRNDLQPERLVAYAMAELAVAGNTITADGAAFQDRDGWWNLKFRCDLSSDRQHVTAFAFAVGDTIPAREWEAHGLPADHAPDED